jgi:multidrug efflux pump subunit AcrA (membrane-fusion protein)
VKQPEPLSIRRQIPLISACLLLSCSTSLKALESSPLFTGEVFSRQAQDIIVPLTPNWQAGISKMLEEGAAARPGDVVVEFDGAEAASQLEQQRETARAALANTERDLAILEKELLQASYALKMSELDLELAELRAATPEGLIGAIEYAENQLALESAEKALTDARKQLADKDKSLRERRKQAALDDQKLELTESWWQEMLNSFSVVANQSGFIIYGNHPWNRAKFQEGDTVRTSFKVAQIADTSDLAIRIWINSVDRPHITSGVPVNIVLDALPERSIEGKLTSISDSGSKRAEWGQAVYFEGIVSFENHSIQGLLPGMSALVEPL